MSIVKDKSIMEVLFEMSKMDEKNVTVCIDLIEMKSDSKGARVTMGAPFELGNELITKTKIPMLVFVDTEEYLRLSEDNTKT